MASDTKKAVQTEQDEKSGARYAVAEAVPATGAKEPRVWDYQAGSAVSVTISDPVAAMDILKEMLESGNARLHRQKELPGEDAVCLAEDALGFEFGPYTRDFLLSCGGVSCGSFETVVIRERDTLYSPMVTVTEQLKAHIPSLPPMAVISEDECGWYCVTPADRVCLVRGEYITDLGLYLPAFLLERVQQAMREDDGEEE